MAKATKERSALHPEAEENYIFDADFHLNVHPSDLIEKGYIAEGPIRNKLDQYGLPPSSGISTGTGLSAEYAKDTEVPPDHMHGAAITPEEILEVTKETGADNVLVNPGNFLFPLGQYPEIKNALAQAYNDYLVEEVIDLNKGIYGGLVVPNWDIELGLEELERHGAKDGIIAGVNWIPGWRPWGHERHDPLYDKLIDLNLPLQLHVGGISNDQTTLLHESKRTYIESTMVANAEGVVAAVLNIVMTGVFDKYPDLDIIVNETGTNWAPFVAYRADNWYQNSPEDICLAPRMREMEKQYLDKMPSEYIFEDMYMTTQPISLPQNPILAKGLMDASHAEQTFIFSTDWPHSTVDGPNWVFNNPQIDEELEQRILHENAERVYRFPTGHPQYT